MNSKHIPQFLLQIELDLVGDGEIPSGDEGVLTSSFVMSKQNPLLYCSCTIHPLGHICKPGTHYKIREKINCV